MKNETTLKIPKKYESAIKEIYKDSEGYWVYAEKGYIFANTGCHTAHEYTQKDIMSAIRTLESCTCSDCQAQEVQEAETVEVVEVEDRSEELLHLINIFIENLPIKRSDAIRATRSNLKQQIEEYGTVTLQVGDEEKEFTKAELKKIWKKF